MVGANDVVGGCGGANVVVSFVVGANDVVGGCGGVTVVATVAVVGGCGGVNVAVSFVVVFVVVLLLLFHLWWC